MTIRDPVFIWGRTHRCFSIENKLFNKNYTHSRSFLSLTRFFLLSVGYWPYQHSSTKSPPLETPGCFVLHGRKVQKHLGFVCTFSLDVWCCADTTTGDGCLAKTPVCFLSQWGWGWGFCQSLSTSGTKKKKNKNRRHDGMDASQIMHFLSFLV